MVLGGVILYASYYGCDQSEAQRALSAKSESDLKKMMLANGIFRFPITLLYCLAGLVVGTLTFNDANLRSQIPKYNPDWLMPVFFLNYLPLGLIGLLVVAILAAAMSSLSSAINFLPLFRLKIISSSLKRAKPEGYLSHAKFAGLLWGGIILLLSLNAGDIAPTVIEAVNKGPLFFLVLSWLCFYWHANEEDKCHTGQYWPDVWRAGLVVVCYLMPRWLQ